MSPHELTIFDAFRESLRDRRWRRFKRLMAIVTLTALPAAAMLLHEMTEIRVASPMVATAQHARSD